MKQQHHPKDVKSFEKGVNSDANKELLGNKQGEHVDAKNMRSISMDGDNYAKKKIKGEMSVFQDIDNRCLNGTGQPLIGDYECMMTQSINGYIVEAWATALGSPYQPSLMRIDGKIVLMSEDFPIRVDYPLEYDKNETCVGGEFYITDNKALPMVFNVRDLLLNSGVTVNGEMGICGGKYFDDFDIELYVVGISSSLYKIAFIKQLTSTTGAFEFVFGSEGMLVGMYSYSYRYVTTDGDRSGWSPVSEMIPVIKGTTQISDEFPKAGTYAGDPNLASPTSYGNHIKLRYDNENQFEFIEIRRDGWYAGASLGTPPNSEILGSFPASVGLNTVDVFDYASSTETQEPLTVEEIADVPETIKTAKAIRYYNSKLWLMNVKYQSRDIGEDLEFVDDPELIVPVIEKIHKKGHMDTYNAAYYKSNMRGEANGFGVVVYDSSGARTYAKSIIDSFEFPNRRDRVSTETLGLSYGGVVFAADSNGVAPSITHEIFDHADAIARDVYDEEHAATESGWNGPPTLVNILKENAIPFGSTTAHEYATLEPISQTDSSSDYNRRINTHVYHENGNEGFLEPVDYNPKAFGIDYYSMGAGFKGINTPSLPSWADGFSVVQTEPAKRVIAQGLGFYELRQAGGAFGSNSSKSPKSIICSFPDLDPQTGIDPGFVTNNLIGTHGIDSPYRLQVVSPLGFFSEFYSYHQKGWGIPSRWKRTAIDGIAHCRVLHDAGLINPDWAGKTSLNNYVGFGSWRDTTDNTTTFNNNQNPFELVIESIEESPTNTDSAVNLRITTSLPIYTKEFGAGEKGDYNHPDTMQWHEPVYVVNIIRPDAEINPGLTTQYKYTGHYIKLNSKILESDGSNLQSVNLVSERWEDCIQRINNQVYNDYSFLERFTYVVDDLGTERRWLNVSEKTPAQVGLINTDIINNGFYVATDASGSYNIYGVYTSSQSSDGTSQLFTLTFTALPSSSNVFVKYDNRIPVRVFGGDTYINDHIFPVIDNEYDSGGNPISGHEFAFDTPFPFPVYSLNAQIGLVGNADADGIVSRYLTNTPNLNNSLTGSTFLYKPGLIYFNDQELYPSRIRQLVAQWTGETRINLSFAYNIEVSKAELSEQTFPLKNYIYRPSEWKSGSDVDVLPPEPSNFFDDNHIYDRYYDDYGREHDNWGFGGFRMLPAVNLDFSKKQTTELITSAPSLGFEEEIEFCTRVLWSVTRPSNIQDSPSVKTFMPNSFKDIDDSTGEIKFAWDADSGKGNNLYAITNNGVCLLLVDKRIISEINADELATVGSDIGGVSDELWIEREKGMDNETWRSWAEYANTLFWVNSTSSYALKDNKVKDLAETGYSEQLRTDWIKKANKGVVSNLAGVYDILHKEYYANVNNKGQSGENHSTLIFGTTQDALQCSSDYDYDKYLAVNNKVYGMKGMTTYELGIGNLIDGEEFECYVTGASNADMYSDKEFIRIRVNSNSKPKRIEFYDDYSAYKAGTISSIVDATANPINIKDYHGYECYIPRKAFAPYNRQQGRLVIFKIVSDDNEEFFISTAGIQYKTLK